MVIYIIVTLYQMIGKVDNQSSYYPHFTINYTEWFIFSIDFYNVLQRIVKK
jgi:hypothetical protein